MDYNITYRQKDKGLQAIISYKDSNGKWKQKSKQGFENSRGGKAKAKEWALKTLSELETTVKIESEYTDMLFKNFVKIYLEDKKGTVTLNTYKTNEYALGKFSNLNNIMLSKITPIHIKNSLKELSNNLKPVTVKNYYTALKTLFKAAMDEYKILTVNPCSKYSLEPSASEEKRALTKEEQKKLIKEMKKVKNPIYYIGSLIALRCGLRVGEILGLTWDNVDFKNKTIYVRKQWKLVDDKKYGFGKLKTNNSSRDVPVSDFVLNELKEYKLNRAIDISNRVIPCKNTRSFITLVIKHYKKFGFDISIHELRHTYATNLVANGLDFKTVAKLMGHTVEQTMAIYSHVTDDMIKRARTIIDKF